MFVTVFILELVLIVTSLIGIAVGIRKKNRILLIIAAIIYVSLLIFAFGAYGIDIGVVLTMIGGLGIAIGVGLKLERMWMPLIILIIIVYIISYL